MPQASVKLQKAAPREADEGLVLSTMDRAIEPRVLTPARLGIAAGLALLVAVVAIAHQRFGAQRTVTLGAERLAVATVGYDRFHDYIPVTGNIVPRTTVYLDAIDGGQVTAVLVEPGSVVAAGEPLVVLKNTNLQLEVIGREAQLTEQLNNLSGTTLAFEQNRLRHRRELIEIDYRIDQITRHLAQRQPLLASGGTTQAQIDDLEAELDYQRALRGAVEEAQRVDQESQETQMRTLREAIEAMNENLSIARENLEGLVITAPIAGQLTVFEANVGESKSPGQRIGQLDEQGTFKVAAFVDEFYLSRVRIGQSALVEIRAQEHVLEVVKVYPDVRNRQFEIELAFRESPPASIRRGQTVRMRLEIGEPTDALVLANGAFYEDTGGLWVFVLDESGDFAERRDVRFGRRNPERIEVIEGLRPGESVITSSYQSLLDFDRIQLRANTI